MLVFTFSSDRDLIWIWAHLGQLAQAHAHLLEVGLGLGLDGDLDHGVGEVHALQDDGRLLVAQGVACAVQNAALQNIIDPSGLEVCDPKTGPGGFMHSRVMWLPARRTGS